MMSRSCCKKLHKAYFSSTLVSFGFLDLRASLRLVLTFALAGTLRLVLLILLVLFVLLVLLVLALFLGRAASGGLHGPGNLPILTHTHASRPRSYGLAVLLRTDHVVVEDEVLLCRFREELQ